MQNVRLNNNRTKQLGNTFICFSIVMQPCRHLYSDGVIVLQLHGLKICVSFDLENIGMLCKNRNKYAYPF